jgi:hypothetical protein
MTLDERRIGTNGGVTMATSGRCIAPMGRRIPMTKRHVVRIRRCSLPTLRHIPRRRRPYSAEVTPHDAKATPTAARARSHPSHATPHRSDTTPHAANCGASSFRRDAASFARDAACCKCSADSEVYSLAIKSVHSRLHPPEPGARESSRACRLGAAASTSTDGYLPLGSLRTPPW